MTFLYEMEESEKMEMEKKKTRFTDSKNRIQELERLMCRIYEDMILEKIPNTRYEILNNVVYTESWCSKYENRATVKHWFNEWNTRGKVLAWDIKQFFHSEHQTVVEWYFKNKMNDGRIEEFDGISLVEWTKENKIKKLKEFGCNINHYNPYENSEKPQFRDDGASWF